MTNSTQTTVSVDVHLIGHWGNMENLIGSVDNRVNLVNQTIQDSSIPFQPMGMYGTLLSVREAPKDIINPDFVICGLSSNANQMTIRLSPRLNPTVYNQAWWDNHYIVPMYYTEDDKTFSIRHWLTYSKAHTVRASVPVAYQNLPTQTSCSVFEAVSFLRQNEKHENGLDLVVVENTPEQTEQIITQKTTRLKDDTLHYQLFLNGSPVERLSKDILEGRCYIRPSDQSSGGSLKRAHVEVYFDSCLSCLKMVTGSDNYPEYMAYLEKQIADQKLNGSYGFGSNYPTFKITGVDVDNLTITVEWVDDIDTDTVNDCLIHPVFMTITGQLPTLIGFSVYE